MNVDVGLVAGSVSSLLVVMLVGVISRISGVLNRETTKKLSSFLVLVLQPCLIVSSMQLEYTPELLADGFGVMLASLLLHAGAAFVAVFAYRRCPDRERRIYKVATVFGNCGFLGFPVLETIYGPTGLFYGACYVFVFNILMFSYGVYVYIRGTSAKLNLRRVFLNVGTVSSAIGFLLFIMKISLPAAIGSALEMVGDMTFPTSMIVIGALACEKGYKKLFSPPPVYCYALIKLMMLPVLTLMFCLVFRVSSDITYLCVTMTAVPGATAAATFADIYGGDSRLAAKLVGFSTVLSVLTIPLMLQLTDWVYSLAGL